MTNFREQIDQLRSLAREAELRAQFACERDTQEHNQRLAFELREAARRIRSREHARAALH
jgi:hypothetical protein